MARITVEDCLENVNNRFDLVLKASKRARELSLGAEATLPWDNDKPTVMALREIAENTILTRELEASEHFDIELETSVEETTEEVSVEQAADAAQLDGSVSTEEEAPKPAESGDEGEPKSDDA